MTDADKNRKVAEVCRYGIHTPSWGKGEIGLVVDETGKTLGTIRGSDQDIPPFDPLHDANQAIAALVKVFGTQWVLEPSGDGFQVGWWITAEQRGGSEKGSTLGEAAVNAILAAKVLT